MNGETHGFKSIRTITSAREREVTRRKQVRQEGELGLVTPLRQTDSPSYSSAISPSPRFSDGSVWSDVLGRRQQQQHGLRKMLHNTPAVLTQDSDCRFTQESRVLPTQGPTADGSGSTAAETAESDFSEDTPQLGGSLSDTPLLLTLTYYVRTCVLRKNNTTTGGLER